MNDIRKTLPTQLISPILVSLCLLDAHMWKSAADMVNNSKLVLISAAISKVWIITSGIQDI